MEERKLIELARTGDADAFCRLYGSYQMRLYRYAFYRLGNAADAEDAVSECVLSAWKQIGSLRKADAFPAWIFRILSACCGRLIRQQIQRRNQVSLDAADSGSGFSGGSSGSGDGFTSGSDISPGSGGNSGDDGNGSGGGRNCGGEKTASAGSGNVAAIDGGGLRVVDDPLQVTEDTAGWLVLQEALEQLSAEERNIVLLSAVGGLKSHEIAELTGMTAGSVRSSLSRSLKKLRGYLQ